MKRIFTVAFLFCFSGCATLERAATAKETFAVCRVVDTATTLYAVHHGAVELNSIMGAALRAGAGVFIGVQVAAVLVVWYYWPQMTRGEKTAVNVIGCIPPVWNLNQLHKG